MEKGKKEDLEIDRRDSCTEQCIVHIGGNFKPVNTDSKSHKVKHRTEFLVMAVILVGMVIGLFYFVHQLNIEMQRQFGEMQLQFEEMHRQFEEMQVQFGEIKQQLSALRSDVADNRRLIEANSTQLESLRPKVGETNKSIDEVNDCLDNGDKCLAVVENVLSIDHQTPAYCKPGKL